MHGWKNPNQIWNTTLMWWQKWYLKIAVTSQFKNYLIQHLSLEGRGQQGVQKRGKAWSSALSPWQFVTQVSRAHDGDFVLSSCRWLNLGSETLLFLSQCKLLTGMTFCNGAGCVWCKGLVLFAMSLDALISTVFFLEKYQPEQYKTFMMQLSCGYIQWHDMSLYCCPYYK